MDKNQLKKEINVLRSKNKILNIVELNCKEDYEWLLVEVRVEREKINSHILFSNDAILLVAFFSLLLSAYSTIRNNEYATEFENIFLILIILALAVFAVYSRLGIYSKKNRVKLVEIKKLEEYIIMYLGV